MVQVNGVEMPLEEQSGVLVLEGASGHQSWALIVDATVEYGDAEFRGDEHPQMKVTATMKPGEILRVASTFEAGEENVLVYSRLLVAVLREERERYSELEKRFHEQGVQLRKAREENGTAAREHAKALRKSWRNGARSGYKAALGDILPSDLLEQNPHPLPEDDETDGCRICGGPDH